MKHWEVKDTSHNIPVTTYTTELSTQDPSTHVVIANGFVGGSLACELASRLHDASKGMVNVSAHDEPYVGINNYSDSYRAELFDKVARKIGGRVVVLAHSRGMVAWKDAGPDLLKDEIVQGLAGLTPIGVSQLPHESIRPIAARLAREIVHPPFRTVDSTRMTVRVAAYILQRCRRPQAFRDEVVRTLQTDTSESVIATSQTIPTVVVVGTNDTLIPPEEVRSQLSADAGYAGNIIELPMTHAGAFADHRHVPALHTAMQDML